MMRNHQQDKRNELEVMKNRLKKMKNSESQLYILKKQGIDF